MTNLGNPSTLPTAPSARLTVTAGLEELLDIMNAADREQNSPWSSTTGQWPLLEVLAAPKLTPWLGDMQEAGMRAIADLDKSLDEFMELMERKDKQDVPIKQQEALGYVGIIEEAMVKGFPYEVPKQYANLPQLKVRIQQPTTPCEIALEGAFAHWTGCKADIAQKSCAS